MAELLVKVVAVSQKRLKVPPYIQLVVVLPVRVRVDAAPLAPNVKVNPAMLTIPEVMVINVVAVVLIPKMIDGMVANVLLKVSCVNEVDDVPPIV